MSNKATLIMLIGLPASGKSTWSERYIRDKPETVGAAARRAGQGKKVVTG